MLIEFLVDRNESSRSEVKVLQLIKARNFAGSEQSVLTLSRELIAQGHEVIVGVKSGGILARRLRSEGFSVLEVPGFAWWLPFWIRRWSEKNGIDLIHTHLTGAARIGERVARSKTVKLVAHLRILKADVVFRKIAQSGALVANSRYTADWHIEKLGLSPDKVFTIYNSSKMPGRSLSIGERDELKATIGAELGLAKDGRLLVIPGRVSPGKGQRIVVEAMAELRETAPDLRLVIVGDLKQKPAYVQELKTLISERGLAEVVVFTGFRQDVARFIGAADVVVIPSEAEPFGLVVIEAMMAGVPLVAAKTGGIPEILENGRWGRLVVSREPRDWAQAIREVLEQPELASALAADARAAAMVRFGPPKMTSDILAVYKDLLKEVRPPVA